MIGKCSLIFDRRCQGRVVQFKVGRRCKEDSAAVNQVDSPGTDHFSLLVDGISRTTGSAGEMVGGAISVYDGGKTPGQARTL